MGNNGVCLACVYTFLAERICGEVTDTKREGRRIVPGDGGRRDASLRLRFLV